jgi:hypothetical protein
LAGKRICSLIIGDMKPSTRGAVGFNAGDAVELVLPHAKGATDAK